MPTLVAMLCLGAAQGADAALADSAAAALLDSAGVGAAGAPIDAVVPTLGGGFS